MTPEISGQNVTEFKQNLSIIVGAEICAPEVEGCFLRN